MIDIKQFRKDNNLSQIDLANILGCTQGFVSSLERGKRPIPEGVITKLLSFPNYNTRYLLQDNNKGINTEKSNLEKTVTIDREVFDVLKNLSETVLSQQRTIEIIETKAKKTSALKDDNAECAGASGSDLVK